MAVYDPRRATTPVQTAVATFIRIWWGEVMTAVISNLQNLIAGSGYSSSVVHMTISILR